MTENEDELKKLLGEKAYSVLVRKNVGVTSPPRQVKVAELIHDKSYDKLTTRLPYDLKTEFEQICRERQRRPSEQVRMFIQEFVKKNRKQSTE